MSAGIKENNPYKIYLKYAEDLEEAEPVVALCCRIYYTKKFVEAKQKTGQVFTPDEEKYVAQLIRDVEFGQGKLGMSSETRKEKLEEFCTKIFLALEKEELTAEELTKIHAVQFNATANFVELLSIFGNLSPQWEDRSMFIYIIADRTFLQVQSGCHIEMYKERDKAAERETEKLAQSFPCADRAGSS